MDNAIFGKPSEHGVGLGVWIRRGFGLRRVRGGFERRRGGLAGGVRTLHSAIHGLVGETVGVLVFVAEGMADLEAFELGIAAFCLIVKGLEVGALDLIFALDLLDHQLRIADDAQAGMVVVEGVLKAAEEARVLGVVVGPHAEKLAQFGEDHALIVLDERAVAGGAGIAAGATVAVGVNPAGLLGSRGGWGGRFGEEARGGGRTGRHWVSLPDGAEENRCPRVLTFPEFAGLLQCYPIS